MIVEVETLDEWAAKHGVTDELPAMPHLVQGRGGQLRPGQRLICPDGYTFRPADQASSGIDFRYTPGSPADALAWQLEYHRSRKHFAGEHAKQAQVVIRNA